MPAGGWTGRWRQAVPSLSRERLKVLTKAGALTRDGNAVRDPATKVKGDERFTLALPDPEPAHNEPQEIPLPIVYEDEHLLVVDKPAGLVVHPAAGNRDGTLGQRPAPPLRRLAERDRRRGPAGDRPSHRQGYVGPAGGRQARQGA